MGLLSCPIPCAACNAWPPCRAAAGDGLLRTSRAQARRRRLAPVVASPSLRRRRPRPAPAMPSSTPSWPRPASTALAQGITAQTFDSATAGIAPIPAIAGHECQPAGIRQAGMELSGFGGIGAANQGRAIHAGALWRCRWTGSKRQSGVPKEILVAIWGMETDYGADSGGFNLFAALATLAYDGPRADYAKPEFFDGAADLSGPALCLERHGGAAGPALSARPSSPPPPFSNTPPMAMAMARSICGIRPPDALASAAQAAGASRVGSAASPGAMKSSCRRALPMRMPISTAKSPWPNGARAGVTTAGGDPLPASADNAAHLSAGRGAWSGLSGVPQFQRDPEIQQCRQLRPGGVAAGGPHGWLRAGAPCLAAGRTRFVPQRADQLPEPICKSWDSIPARLMACWGGARARHCASTRNPKRWPPTAFPPPLCWRCWTGMRHGRISASA